MEAASATAAPGSACRTRGGCSLAYTICRDRESSPGEMTQRSGRILVVDDDAGVLTAARLLLKRHFAVVQTESDPARLSEHLRTGFDVILLDMNFARGASSGAEGFHWLGQILAADASAVVVLMTAYGDVATAVRAIKAGATDFVLKPWQNEKLLATVTASLRLRGSRDEVARLRSRERELVGMAPGRSPGAATRALAGRARGCR